MMLPPTTTGPEAVVVRVGVAWLTVREAVAVVPVPPFVEVTAPVVLFFTPAAVPKTFIENVHEELTAKFAPLKLTDELPAVAVIVPPPQKPVKPLGVAITKPEGSKSVNATPVKATVLTAGFVSVKLKVVVPFKEIEEAPKFLLIVGGATTVVEALAVLPVPPLVEVTAPVVLFCRPAAAPVTVTLKLQMPPPVIDAPVKAIVPGEVVVNVPPH